MSDSLRRIGMRKQLLMGVAISLCSFMVSSTVFAGSGTYRGCKINTPCNYAGHGYSTGFCEFRGDPEPYGQCVCYEAGTSNYEGTCECSTGQYPPCGGGLEG